MIQFRKMIPLHINESQEEKLPLPLLKVVLARFVLFAPHVGYLSPISTLLISYNYQTKIRLVDLLPSWWKNQTIVVHQTRTLDRSLPFL